MKLGKQSPHHLHNGREISDGTKWWIDNGQITLERLFCVHNVALSVDCVECAEKT